MKASKVSGGLMRSRAREAALQYLYQLDFSVVSSYSFSQFLQELYDLVSEDEISEDYEDHVEISDNAIKFAEEIVKGVHSTKKEIDDVISKNAENWSVSRMAPVDRNVIRIATYEMVHRDDIPNRVAINEAINMAKKFGGEKSGAFVNSVLDKIRAHLESKA